MDLHKIPRVTGQDVARLANVSQATVSYVLNDAPGQRISEQTKQAVLRAADELGYRPNEAARRLASGRSRVVLLIVPPMLIDTHARLGELVIEAASALTVELAAHGLNLSVQFSRERDGGDVAELAVQLDASAVMLMGPVPAAVDQRLSTRGVVAVRLLGAPGAPTTVFDEEIGAVQIDHLATRGHSAIAYARPDAELRNAFGAGRERGALARTRDRGLAPLQVATLDSSGSNAANTVVNWHNQGVTAVAAFNDDVAFVVLHGMRAAGLTCPDDLAVIGVDNRAAGVVADPPLTSIRPLLDVWAQSAVEMLRSALQGSTPFPTSAAAIAEVVQRAST